MISEEEFNFTSIFLFRSQKISNNNIAYINNDIQFGSKYILKRVLDLVVTLLAFPILFILFVISNLFVLIADGYPSIIRSKKN